MNKYIRIAYYLAVVVITAISSANLFGNDASSGTSLGLYLTYALIGLAVSATIIASVYYMVTHPKQGLRSLISIAVLGAILFLGYMIGPGEMSEKYISFGVTSESGSKLVDSGLISVYVLAGGAIVAALYSEVRGIFK